MTIRTWTLGSLLLLATGCGSTEMKSSDSFRNGSQAPAAGTGDATAAPQQPQPTNAQCASNTLWLHGDHETCDQADIQAANGTVPPATTPAPTTPAAQQDQSGTTVASNPAPAAPAPAPAPAAAAPAPAAPAPAAPAAPPKDPNIVEVRIKAGTGNNGYNTAATPVTVKVGQTLRLFNDDTVVHRLHTSGSPCAHQPANTAPGASFDCVVSKAIDTTVAPGMGAVYDHDAGPTSLFFLKATP